MSKGQYLAVESVLTLAIGISVAIGSITVFSDYKADVMETGRSEQIDMVQSRITTTVYSLEHVENGQETLDLPEKVGSREYFITFREGVAITSRDRELYYNKYNNLIDKYSFSGRVRGGSVKIFKRGNEYILRET